MAIVWTFETDKLLIELECVRSYGYKYDGDDEDGETQAALNRGDLVAFDSFVRVHLKNGESRAEPLAVESLYGSVYEKGRISAFWTDHRDPDPMNRNCSLFRKQRGENSCIAHYFPDMVREAIRAAREILPRNKGDK